MRRFTLIELLVVIAIIGILASLLLPSLQKARKKAESAVCLLQLRQIATASLLYEDSYDELIGAYTPADAPRGAVLWPTSLGEFLGSEEIVMCPSARTPTPSRWGQRDLAWVDDFQFPEAASKPEVSSYGQNMWMTNFDISLNPWGWKNVYPEAWHFTDTKLIEHSAETPMFGDCMWTGGWPRNTDGPWVYEFDKSTGAGSWNASIGRFAITRHDARINSVFADGHARGVDLSEIWRLYWHRKSIPRDLSIPWE